MLEVQTLAISTHPYTGSTNSCFLNKPLHWRYNPTLMVHPYAGGTEAADPYSTYQSCGYKTLPLALPV